MSEEKEIEVAENQEELENEEAVEVEEDDK